ncbi:putative cardiolipin synthetase [Trypanosoma grayi]|uniref:putative cardiolipin synthetase n=1 Tax=Trypanosoma grayi TaxID=71804 RepID=UPI0004F47117|nr:putative cardiolipin synthetase [Trypanosoma grayi]KEG13558.1 putative cardiolipin synthetase [Trypanosoma grayi]
MRIHGARFRVTLQRINVRTALSSPQHEARRSNSDTNSGNNSDNGSNDNTNKNSSTAGGYLNGMYSTFGVSRRSYYRGLPFDERWDRIQRHLGVLGRVSAGNTVIPYRDGAESFRVMWKAIDESKKSVLWQTYICKDDHVGRVTVAKMEAAHRRGCRTELLYDCGGNITGRRRLVGNLKQSGATVIEHRPFFDHFWQYMLGGMKWERSPAIRNHRKILLVDDTIGFCGGLNIGNEYCGKSQGGTGRFRDTHCSVTGPAVAHLREVYDDTKAPKPWKWSWARWRQIAAVTMNLRYKEGKNVTDEILLPMKNSMQQNGKVYMTRQFVKAGKGTARIMERMRWRRQREQLERLMQWCQDETTEEPKRETGDIENTCTKISSDNGKSAVRCRMRSSTAKQKTEKCDAHALSQAQGMFEQRVCGKWILAMPLNDTDPVPGAVAYGETRPTVTQVLSCNPHTRDWSIPYAFWQVSQKAHRRLWVTTPYYMPHRKLMLAILRAARRGVDVRILAGSCHTTDPWFMWYASNYITERLLAAGVRVYEYKGDQVMHAKTVVVDSIWSSVGSYNWDMMSNKNMEVCVCHLGYDLAREMEEHFLADLQVSIELNYDEYKRRSWWLRFASWFFYGGLQIAEKLTFRTFRDADLSSEIGGLR